MHYLQLTLNPVTGWRHARAQYPPRLRATSPRSPHTRDLCDIRARSTSRRSPPAPRAPTIFTYVTLAERPSLHVCFMAIIAMKGTRSSMRTVNVAKLKDQLSKYLTFAKSG